MSTTSFPTHAGLERVLKAGASVKGSVKALSNVADVANIVALFGVTALVTVVARHLESGEASFAVEWAMLFAIGVLGFWILARLVAPLLEMTKSGYKKYVAYRIEKMNDDAFFEAARRDPRLMREISAAQSRATH
jgi:hypothetical protein